MTRIFMDNREIEPPNDSSSVGQILKYIDETHLAGDRVVRKVQVNGYRLMPDDLVSGAEQAMADRPDERLDKVEIYTGNLAEIARGSITEALAYLDRIEGLIPSLAWSYRKQPLLDSPANVRQLYEGFYWLQVLLERLQRDFPIQFEDDACGNGFSPEYQKKFVTTLKRLKKSQEMGDLAQVADLLECEILPFVPLWREMFLAVAQKVDGRQ